MTSEKSTKFNTPKEWYEWHSDNYSHHLEWEQLSKDTKEWWIVEFDKRFIYIEHTDK